MKFFFVYCFVVIRVFVLYLFGCFFEFFYEGFFICNDGIDVIFCICVYV